MKVNQKLLPLEKNLNTYLKEALDVLQKKYAAICKVRLLHHPGAVALHRLLVEFPAKYLSMKNQILFLKMLYRSPLILIKEIRLK